LQGASLIVARILDNERVQEVERPIVVAAFYILAGERQHIASLAFGRARRCPQGQGDAPRQEQRRQHAYAYDYERLLCLLVHLQTPCY